LRRRTKKANKSQAEINKERIKLSEEYQKCRKKPKGTKIRRLGGKNIKRRLKHLSNSLKINSEIFLKLTYLRSLSKNL
jgi:hypothetical protein